MNNFKMYGLLSVIFLIGNYPAFALAFLQWDVGSIPESSLREWNRINDVSYFLAIFFSCKLLKGRNADFTIFKTLFFSYGVASLIYDDLTIRIAGFLFLIIYFFDTFNGMFQDLFFRKNNSGK